MIVEKAYAKINLALEVKEKREDGFHEINTIMLPVDLYDELTFSSSKEIIYRSNLQIENDIVLKSIGLFYKKYNIKDGVCVTLEKIIPLSAGLAGGSSDAAAVLRGLNKFFKLNVSLKELEEIANEIGSDVSYCLYQQASFCNGRGECVNPLNIKYDEIDITIIKPTFGLSTKLIYDNYKYVACDRKEYFDCIVKALKENNPKLLKANIFNDLSKSAFSQSDKLYELYNNLKENGYNPFLSGSGPTLFLIGETLDSNIKATYKDFFIYETKIL